MQIRHLPTTCHLRAYQSEALNAVCDAYRSGKRRVIVSLPTGTGKTVVFAHFPRVLKMKKRSEERRVGKECRSRWWREHSKKSDVNTRRTRHDTYTCAVA